MNGLGWFIVGMLVGVVYTYWFFILFAKVMAKKQKKALMEMAGQKWGTG